MGDNYQQTIPLVKTSSIGGSNIQGDICVIDFERKISHTFSWADANVIHQRLAVAAGTVLAAAFTGNQCDCPRNVQVVDNGVGVGNTGNVIITGLNQYGNPDTETIAITTLGTTEGVKAWSYIISIQFPAITDTNVEVQVASKIGIAGDLRANGLKTVAKDPAGVGAKEFMPAASFTVNTVYDTVEETGVAIAAGDVYDYYFKG